MSDIKYAHQRIFFGAPGTGKSNKLNKQAEDCFGKNYERVTFYSNFMYGNFVGSYKPFPKEKNGQEYIAYEYIGGVLMKQLINALKNPNENYLLVIEEINRANVSAVFGDTFQLLDRDEDGKSEYFISTSIELQKYLSEQLKDIKAKNENYVDLVGENFERLKFPGNFYIWATMNSADQGVMPMDTAFKRRWDFEYIGIDESVSSDFDEYYFYISDKEMVKWNDFRVELNRALAELNIPEDKLLGPYFISKSILSNPEKLTEAIKNKVLMYLYEDVVRSNRHNLFVDEKQRTYSELCENFTKYGLEIFNEKFEGIRNIDKYDLEAKTESTDIKKIDLANYIKSNDYQGIKIDKYTILGNEYTAKKKELAACFTDILEILNENKKLDLEKLSKEHDKLIKKYLTENDNSTQWYKLNNTEFFIKKNFGIPEMLDKLKKIILSLDLTEEEKIIIYYRK